jgi:hypothetical protein
MTTTATTMKKKYEPICEYVNDARESVEKHAACTPKLRLAMNHFGDKSHELHTNFNTSNLIDSVIEIEHAADGALRVAAASNAPLELTEQIRIAHDKVRDFRQEAIN